MAKGDKRRCKRCGYSWTQRTEGMPRRCANRECRSPYWQTEAYRVRQRPEKLDISAGDIDFSPYEVQ